MPAPFRLYDTRTASVREIVPIEPGKVRIYVCGMTVYDDAHVGHARAFVVFDTLVRYLQHRGWQVTYVRNFTDVDDKIIRQAAKNDETPEALADRMVERFGEDMAALGLRPPDREPRVTRTMPEIVAMIGELVAKGHAYAAQGSVWFSVPSFPAYGALSHQQVAECRSEDADDGKRSPADFALWKAAKPGEPTWDSPWGAGRPGWHIECSAMARQALGEQVDIHGGGLDLVFPHHENEVAQSECAHGVTFASLWMHNGLLTTPDGTKMGHSKGNFVRIRDVLRDYPAEAMRVYYLQNHWRSPLPYDEAALPEALGMLARLYEAREVAERFLPSGRPAAVLDVGGSEEADDVARSLGGEAMEVLALARAFPTALHAALDDDFNTSKALGHAFELARAVNRLSNHKKALQRGGPVVAPALAAFRLLADAVGVLTLDTAAFTAEIKAKRLPKLGLTPDDVERLLADRIAARAGKDWATADRIRDELEGKGIAVMDRPGGGSEWRVRL